MRNVDRDLRHGEYVLKISTPKQETFKDRPGGIYSIRRSHWKYAVIITVAETCFDTTTLVGAVGQLS